MQSNMRRGGGYGFQQQSCGGAVYQEAQQQSYAMHQQELGYSKNQYHNQFSGMEIMPAPYVDPRPMKQQQYKFSGKQSTVQQNGGWVGQEMHHNGGWVGQEMNQNGGWVGQEMHQSAAYSNQVSGGKRLPFNGYNANSAKFSSSQGGAGMCSSNEMEHAEYESFRHEEMHVPRPAVKVQEMRYEHSSWGGNNCGDNFNRKPNRYYGAPACVPLGL